MSKSVSKKVPVVVAAALIAGAALSPAIIASPAQAAGSPIYTAGYWFWKVDCDAARAQKAKDRTLRVSSCKSGFGPSGIPGYYFTYQSAY